MKRQVGCSSVHLEKSSRRKASFCSAVIEKMLPSSDQAAHTPASTLTRTPDVFFFYLKRRWTRKFWWLREPRLSDFFSIAIVGFCSFFLSLNERPLNTSIRWNSFCPWISRRVTWASSAESEPAQFWVNCSFNTHVHFLDKPTRCCFTSPRFTFLWPIERNADEIPALNPRAPPQHREKYIYIYIFFLHKSKNKCWVKCGLRPFCRSLAPTKRTQKPKKTAHCSFSNVCK